MIGGAEHSVKLLAEGLVRFGHKVFVYSMDATPIDKLYICENINGVSVFRGYDSSVYDALIEKKDTISRRYLRLMHCYYNRKALTALKEILVINKIDIVHTNNIHFFSINIFECIHRLNIPIVHTLRDYWLIDRTTEIGRSNALVSFIHKMLVKNKTEKNVDFVTAPSSKMLSVFKHQNYFLNTKSECVVNCIDIDLRLLEEQIRLKEERKSQDFRFLYVGKIASYKGVELLLDSFSKLEDQSISLTLCGDGPLSQYVIDKSKNDKRIKFRGKLLKDELSDEYQKADVLVVPSLWEEPFGRIIIEGSQYGLVLIGSNRGGIPETIKRMNSGIVFDTTTQDSLLKAMTMLLNREKLIKYMHNIGNNIMAYSLESQVKDFVRIYDEIVE